MIIAVLVVSEKTQFDVLVGGLRTTSIYLKT